MAYQTLPSGKLRLQTTIGGKRVSFTGRTQKEIELKRTDYIRSLGFAVEYKENPPISEIIDLYISSKENVLSPSTIAGYRKMQRTAYSDINNLRLSDINSNVLQRFVSDITLIHSAKYVKNIYGLLSSALKQVTDRTFTVTLPKYIRPKLFTPNDNQVKQLLESSSGDLKIAVMLAAFGTLRRGEVCGLVYGDIDRKANTIYVHSDCVLNSDNTWVYKPFPKTDNSIRTICYPKEVIALIPDGPATDHIISITPNALTQQMSRKKKQLGMDISMHSLRRYAASFMHALGIPDKYIMETGGWVSDRILKSVYENTLDEKSIEFSEQRNDYIRNNLI